MGDKILSADADGKTSFATVISVPHSKNSITADFSHIVTVNRDIKLTPDHLIFAGPCGGSFSSSFDLIKAGDVGSDICLKTIYGDEKVRSERKSVCVVRVSI